MEIKDKLTARQVAMQMATDAMIATIPNQRYDIDDHIKIARGLYNWIVGDAELPEVYDPNTKAEKLMDMFMKTHEDFKCQPLWYPILRDHNGKPLQKILNMMRSDCPIYIHDSKHTIVIGSEEEFDRRKQEIIDNADYTHYSSIYCNDMKYPIERPLALGIASLK